MRFVAGRLWIPHLPIIVWHDKKKEKQNPENKPSTHTISTPRTAASNVFVPEESTDNYNKRITRF